MGCLSVLFSFVFFVVFGLSGDCLVVASSVSASDGASKNVLEVINGRGRAASIQEIVTEQVFLPSTRHFGFVLFTLFFSS